MTDTATKPPPATEQPGVAHEELVPEDDRIIGTATKWSAVAVVAIGAIIGGVLYFSRESPSKATVIARGAIEAPPALDQQSAAMPSVSFTDVASGAGIDFVHTSGATGEKLLPETMGGGCAFFDFDNDGDQDLLFVNATHWEHAQHKGPPTTAALYRNDGSGQFENVTAGSGLDESLYGMGVACGDFDNDGRVDVFISALGRNRMFRNVSEGGEARFVDVTDHANVAGEDDDWSTSAGFFDYDNDGDLDLFVCNYVQWSREIDMNLNFTLNGRDRAYGPPLQYKGAHSNLYRNNGDGTFADVSAEAGVRVVNPATKQPMGKALAVTFDDVDRDGFIDILVANDTVQNFLFRNNGGRGGAGDGTFTEIGATSGVAFDSTGNATGAMGIDAGDCRNDGRLAVGIGNFANESTSFYVQQRDAWQFADMAGLEGIGSPSRLKLSFGLFFFDYDLDGRLDMFQTNGHLEEEITEVQPSQSYHQPAQLFWNCGMDAKSCFALVPDERSGDLTRPIVGRGAAFADIDNDGDLDVLLTQTGGQPMLLRNDQNLDHHWLRIKLVGTKCNRDAIGARIELTSGGVTQRRQVMPTRSYLSQVELPVTFGLGGHDVIDSLRIYWAGGGVQDVAVDRVDQMMTITQP